MPIDVMGLMDAGRVAGEQGRERGRNTRLNQLAGQAYGAAPQDQRGLVQQAIQTDRGQGMALGKDLGADHEARTKRAAQKVSMFVKVYKANPSMAGGMYPGIAQEVSQLFPEMQMPTEFSPEFLPGMEQFGASMGGPQDGLPSGLREFNAMTEGMSPEDNLKARRVALGLDGRASTSGFSQVKFTDAQGRDRVGVMNGRTGVIDLPDGTSFNPQTGQTMQTQPAGMQQPQQQRAPGEVPFSIDPSLPPQVQAAIRANEPQWAQASDQSQMQIPQQGGQSYRQPQQGGDMFTSRPAEQQAGLNTAAQEQAKINSEIGNYRTMTGLEVDRAGALARSEQGIKPTKAQEAVDTQYGKEYVEFIQGGAADANKALTELDGVLTQLKRGDNMTGPVLGMLPDAVKARTNPAAAAAQETVESTVQRSLRVILGAQFTEKEGARLIARAYNPALAEEYNIPRVQLLFDQLKAGFENKAAAARYYEQNGTLRGFTGKLPSWGDFNPEGGQQDRAKTTAITTKAQYDALPSGAVYMEDGKRYRKP